MILFADVFIGQVEICLFCDLHAGMSENLTEGKDIHAIHQASLSKIVSQAVRTVFLVQSDSIDVPFEVGFKVVDIDVTAVFLDREEVFAFGVSIFELQPTSENAFGLWREKDDAILATFGVFRSQKDLFFRQFDILNQQHATLPKPHAGVDHEDDHDKIAMLRKIGFVQLPNQMFKILIRYKVLCFSIVF
jgi:hypothetical protein